MPPAKRTLKRLKVGLTPLDWLLLEANRIRMGWSLADHVRLAIRHYTKNNPNISQIPAYQVERVEAEISDPVELEQFRADLKSWLKEDVVIPQAEAHSTATGTIPRPEGIYIESSEAMFEDLD